MLSYLGKSIMYYKHFRPRFVPTNISGLLNASETPPTYTFGERRPVSPYLSGGRNLRERCGATVLNTNRRNPSHRSIE